MINWSKVGRKSQRKGKRGQEEFAKWCRSHGFDYESCRRKDGNGLPGIHAEVKFYESKEKLNVEAALNQATEDVEKFKKETGEDKIPIVAWRVNYQRGWNITLWTIDFVRLFTGEPCKRYLISKVEMDGDEWMKVYKRYLGIEEKENDSM